MGADPPIPQEKPWLRVGLLGASWAIHGLCVGALAYLQAQARLPTWGSGQSLGLSVGVLVGCGAVSLACVGVGAWYSARQARPWALALWALGALPSAFLGWVWLYAAAVFLGWL